MTKQAKKTTTFEAPEGFGRMVEQDQDKAVKAWYAANPNATIQPIEGRIPDTGYPTFLQSTTTKRARICLAYSQPIKVVEFLAAAKVDQGGWRDLAAALAGGYSPKAAGYGNPVVKLVA